jgi:hypothetical protein
VAVAMVISMWANSLKFPTESHVTAGAKHMYLAP